MANGLKKRSVLPNRKRPTLLPSGNKTTPATSGATPTQSGTQTTTQPRTTTFTQQPQQTGALTGQNTQLGGSSSKPQYEDYWQPNNDITYNEARILNDLRYYNAMARYTGNQEWKDKAANAEALLNAERQNKSQYSQLLQDQQWELQQGLGAAKTQAQRLASEQLMGAQNYFAQMMGRMGLSGSGMAGRGAMNVYGRVASGLSDELLGIEQTLRDFQMKERSAFRQGSWGFLQNIMQLGVQHDYDKRLLEFQMQLAQSQQSVWGDVFGAIGTIGGMALGNWMSPGGWWEGAS